MRHSFSRRLGYEPTDKLLGLDQVTSGVINGIWNVLLDCLRFHAMSSSHWPPPSDLVRMLARDHFRSPVDSLPTHWENQRSWLRSALENDVKSSWTGLYNLIEHVASCWESLPTKCPYDQFEKAVNAVFTEELVPYRLVNRKVVPITNAAEVESVGAAIQATVKGGFDGARIHLETAMAKLAERPKPDCRNAIKEAISAVESVVVILTGSKKKGVADALKLLGEKGVQIHGAFNAACGSLYGFTSDADGIRHPILEESNVGFADAKFMVVACSAFVHFLIEKAQEAGLTK